MNEGKGIVAGWYFDGNQEKIIEKIKEERLRQDQKWGQQDHPPGYWTIILMEEVGEVAKDVQKDNIDGYEQEMIQVAAVALSALESLHRQRQQALGSPNE